MGFFTSNEKEKISIIKNCYTGSVVPDYEIQEVLGLIQFTKNKIAVVDVVNDMFKLLVKHAEKEGADAVINSKIMTGSYTEGAGHSSYITVYGEAVKLKYKVKD